MKIYEHGGRLIIEFVDYELARSERMQGWPVWAGFAQEDGKYRVRRVASTRKRGFRVDVTGAEYVVIPYMSNSGRTTYTFVRLPDGEATTVDVSRPDERALSNPFIRAFLYYVPPDAWRWADDITIEDPKGSVAVREVRL